MCKSDATFLQQFIILPYKPTTITALSNYIQQKQFIILPYKPTTITASSNYIQQKQFIILPCKPTTITTSSNYIQQKLITSYYQIILHYSKVKRTLE